MGLIHFPLLAPKCKASRPGKTGAWWLACVGLLACGNAGCIYGSLASDTGHSDEGLWSVAPVQDAHVGELVKFSFILRERFNPHRIDALRIAEYAAANILNERIEAGPNLDSAFVLEYRLDNVAAGRTLRVEVAAFEIRGSKDFMKIRGQWHHSASGIDMPDKRVAKDSIKLRTYQSKIDYKFHKPQIALDWTTARLVITRRDGKVSTVFADQPHRAGFTMNGPDQRGYFHIRYFPVADQVNKTGTTRAALRVLDLNGVQQTYDFEFDTP